MARGLVTGHCPASLPGSKDVKDVRRYVFVPTRPARWHRVASRKPSVGMVFVLTHCRSAANCAAAVRRGCPGRFFRRGGLFGAIALAHPEFPPAALENLRPPLWVAALDLASCILTRAPPPTGKSDVNADRGIAVPMPADFIPMRKAHTTICSRSFESGRIS